MAPVRTLNLHNRYHLICVAPAFDTESWYGHHASDQHIRHDEYLVKEVAGLIDSRYPTVAAPEARLLLGFGKSGWGA